MSESPLLTERALERRVKRWLASGPFDCFVQAAPGLEDLLRTELLQLGFEPGEAVAGGVPVQLDAAGIMLCNLELRTASRVLLRLGNFPAGSREMLYDRARRLPWEVHLGASGTYRLHLVSSRSALQAGDELAQVMIDAIHRHMRELGAEARFDDASATEIHVRLLNDHATISLNTGGEHLHRRGFRRHIGAAPLRETVAAAVVLSAFDGHDTVVDPFCGAGTLLLEAADISSGLAPGRQRRFAFEQAGWFRPGLWREVQRQSAARQQDSGDVLLLGLDADESALEAAARNLRRAGHGSVELRNADSTSFDWASVPGERRLLIANLPFGKRLGSPEQSARLHRTFLQQLARGGTWDIALLTTRPRALRGIGGVRVISEQVISSGGLKMTLVRLQTD